MNQLTYNFCDELAPGSTALHVAIAWRNLESVKYLLSIAEPCFIQYKNTDRQTARDLIPKRIGSDLLQRAAFEAEFIHWEERNAGQHRNIRDEGKSHSQPTASSTYTSSTASESRANSKRCKTAPAFNPPLISSSDQDAALLNAIDVGVLNDPRRRCRLWECPLCHQFRGEMCNLKLHLQSKKCAKARSQLMQLAAQANWRTSIR